MPRATCQPARHGIAARVNPPSDATAVADKPPMPGLATPSLLQLGTRARIDLAQQRLWRDGVQVPLRPKAWQALTYLLRRPGELVTGDALLDALWPGQDVSAKTMANLVSELRAALGDDGAPPQLLQTVHRRGYRLQLQGQAAVRPVAAGQPLPRSAATGDAAADAAGLDPAASIARAGRAATAGVATAALAPRPADPTRHHAATAPSLVRLPSARATDTPTASPAGPGGLIGRATELVRLGCLLGRALEGQRQLALVAGDPGMGKTALLDGFITQAARTRAVVARGACLEQHSAREPFAPVLALLGDLCSGPLAGQTSAALRRCAPTWLAQMPWLVQPHELPALRQGLAGTGPGRMLREFCALVQALASHTPLLLVLEDLHWADTGTIDLLHRLSDERTPAGLMLLASYQPVLAAQTGHPVAVLASRLPATGRATLLTIGPLGGEAIDQFIAERFGDAALAAPLRRWAERQSTGIPLYLQAALHHLVDRGALRWQAGRWQLAEPPTDEALAEPLRALVAARFHRLPPDARSLLEAASVVGMQVPVPLLAAAVAQPAERVEQACQALVRQGEFLRAAGTVHWPDGSGGSRFEFTHDIYRRALHDGLAPGLRQLLHRRVAERLEAGWAGQLGQVAGQLASAYAQAAMPEATARVLEMTAHLSAQRFAPAATIEALQACLQQLALMPASDARHATEIRVQLMLGNMSLNHHGLTHPLTLPAFERARQLARRSGALRDQIRAQLGATVSLVAGFRPEQALALAEDTVALAEAGQPSLAAVAHHYAGFAVALRGDLPRARWHQAHALGLTPDPLVPLYFDVHGSVQVHLGRVDCLMGRLDAGLAGIEAGLARGRAVSTPADLTQKLYWAADTARLLGLPPAADWMAEVLEKAELFDLPGLRAAARLGAACLPAPAERDTALITALAPAYCLPGDHQAALMTSLALAEAHLAQGRPAEARAAWATGRAVTPAGALFEPELLRLQAALVTAEGGDPAEAEALCRAGLALAGRQQARWHALRCALTLHDLPGAPARAELAEQVAGFVGGADLPDLQRARRLLGRSAD